jgi:hypothetical protein
MVDTPRRAGKSEIWTLLTSLCRLIQADARFRLPENWVLQFLVLPMSLCSDFSILNFQPSFRGALGVFGSHALVRQGRNGGTSKPVRDRLGHR